MPKSNLKAICQGDETFEYTCTESKVRKTFGSNRERDYSLKLHVRFCSTCKGTVKFGLKKL